MPNPTTYFLTWTTYGAWLPGDERGSFINDRRDGPGQSHPKPNLQAHAQQLLKHDPIILTDPQRQIVDASIRQHADHRGWNLLALNVRSNHVHAVVVINKPAPKAMTEFKARATRALHERGTIEVHKIIWTRDGSTRHLHPEQSVMSAIQYVLEGQ